MKVIQDASKVPWCHRSNCKSCGSTLEVEKDDLTFVPDSRDGDAFTFECPICWTKNWISASLVPKSAQKLERP
jgi:hypothetical protein